VSRPRVFFLIPEIRSGPRTPSKPKKEKASERDAREASIAPATDPMSWRRVSALLAVLPLLALCILLILTQGESRIQLTICDINHISVWLAVRILG